MKKFKVFMITILLSTSLALFSFLVPKGEPWIAPEGAKQLKNPLEYSDKNSKMGKGIFNIYCKACHGTFGKGDGPVAKTLKAQCANLTSARVQEQSDGEIYYKISVGRVEMPSFKSVITNPQERWLLVNYIRSLKAPEQVNRN